jgi:hypothetical protein
MPALHPFLSTADDQDPIIALYRFFTLFDLPACHRHLSWLTGSMYITSLATTLDAIQRLLFYQQLTGLLQALHQWRLQQAAPAVSVPLNKPPNIRQSETVKPLPWQHLPRHLVRAEYHQPGMVVHDFFLFKRLERWEKLLQDWQTAMKQNEDVVLCTTSEVRTHLHKVVEAGWLLNHLQFI